jgi:hypothetical protein
MTEIIISPQEVVVSPTETTISTSVTTQTVSVSPQPNELGITPITQTISVEVADPSKIGATGATIESVSIVDDTLTMSMTDGRELTAPLTTASIQKEIEIDFGTHSLAEKVFTVVDSDIQSTSIVSVFQSAKAATGKDQDENEMDKLLLCAVAGDGSFTLYAQCFPNVVSGKFKINYLVS